MERLRSITSLRVIFEPGMSLVKMLYIPEHKGISYHMPKF
jgi:hypothetical protein